MARSKVPRWLVVYGVLMAGSAVGNVIGGVPETVSWQLLVGGGVLVLQAVKEYLSPPRSISAKVDQRELAEPDE